MCFSCKYEQNPVSVTWTHYRWSILLMLYVIGMTCAKAMYQPAPSLFESELSAAELATINQVIWPKPVFAPKDLIDDVVFPSFANDFNVITPVTYSDHFLPIDEDWNVFKKHEDTSSQ